MSSVLQLYLTLCDPMDRVLQARILEQGLPFPSPGGLPDLGIEPGFPALQADSLLSEPPGKPSNQHVGCLLLIQKVSQESL